MSTIRSVAIALLACISGFAAAVPPSVSIIEPFSFVWYDEGDFLPYEVTIQNPSGGGLRRVEIEFPGSSTGIVAYDYPASPQTNSVTLTGSLLIPLDPPGGTRFEVRVTAWTQPSSTNSMNPFIRPWPRVPSVFAAQGFMGEAAVYDSARSRLYALNTSRGVLLARDFSQPGIIVTSEITVGNDPSGMDMSPNGNCLLVVNRGDSTITRFDLPSLIPTATISTTSASSAPPERIAFLGDGSAVISTASTGSDPPRPLIGFLVGSNSVLALNGPGQPGDVHLIGAIRRSGDGSRVIAGDRRVFGADGFVMGPGFQVLATKSNLPPVVTMSVNATGSRIVFGGRVYDGSLNHLFQLPQTSESTLFLPGDHIAVPRFFRDPAYNYDFTYGLEVVDGTSGAVEGFATLPPHVGRPLVPFGYTGFPGGTGTGVLFFTDLLNSYLGSFDLTIGPPAAAPNWQAY